MSRPQASEVAAIVAETVMAVPGVVRLDAGPFGTKSTYGPRGKVDGVTVRAGTDPIGVTAHVVVRFGERIPELATTVTDEVRRRLSRVLPAAGPWDIGVDVVDVITGEAPVRRELR